MTNNWKKEVKNNIIEGILINSNQNKNMETFQTYVRVSKRKYTMGRV